VFHLNNWADDYHRPTANAAGHQSAFGGNKVDSWLRMWYNIDQLTILEGTMSVKTVTLNLPTALARELSEVNQDFVLDILARGLRQFKLERALEQYSRGGISFGAAAQLAELSQADLARHAYAGEWNRLLVNRPFRKNYFEF
jgi:hypothetical protein